MAKKLYDELISQITEVEQDQRNSREMPLSIVKIKHLETWWDRGVTALTKIPYNRPDLIIWDSNTDECKIIDIRIPLDINLELRDTTKRNSYVELVNQLQRIYPQYKYCIIPVVIRALGTIPKKRKENLKKIEISGDRIGSLIRNIQKLVLLGTFKIVKNFQKM